MAGGGGGPMCNPGLGDCDGNPATVCETDVTANPDHCGACGIQCESGSCSDSKCDPVVLTSDDANHFAHQGGWVYYGSDDSVKRVKLDGSGMPQELISGQQAANDVDVDDTYVYWTARDAGTLGRIPHAGGAAQPLASGLSSVAHIVLEGDDLYFTEDVSDTGRVLRMPKDGSSAPAAVATMQQQPFEVVRYGGEAYWGTADNFPTESKIWSTTPGGPVALFTFSQPEYDLSPAIDDTSIFWVRGSELQRGARDGSGMPTTLADDNQFATCAHPVLHDSWLYLPTNNGIFRVPKTGGTVQRITTRRAHSLIFVGGEIVFGEFGIYRMPIPPG